LKSDKKKQKGEKKKKKKQKQKTKCLHTIEGAIFFMKFYISKINNL